MRPAGTGGPLPGGRRRRQEQGIATGETRGDDSRLRGSVPEMVRPGREDRADIARGARAHQLLEAPPASPRAVAVAGVSAAAAAAEADSAGGPGVEDGLGEGVQATGPRQQQVRRSGPSERRPRRGREEAHEARRRASLRVRRMRRQGALASGDPGPQSVRSRAPAQPGPAGASASLLAAAAPGLPPTPSLPAAPAPSAPPPSDAPPRRELLERRDRAALRHPAPTSSPTSRERSGDGLRESPGEQVLGRGGDRAEPALPAPRRGQAERLPEQLARPQVPRDRGDPRARPRRARTDDDDSGRRPQGALRARVQATRRRQHPRSRLLQDLLPVIRAASCALCSRPRTVCDERSLRKLSAGASVYFIFETISF